MDEFLLNLLSPETWSAFRETGATISGFRERHRSLAGSRVRQGDIFLCYLTRLSRWCGALEVESGPYSDDSPLHDELDAFPIRFRVKPVVILEPELAIPIHEEKVWNSLSITNQYEKGHPYWTGFLRGSLNRFTVADGSFLIDLLKKQQIDQERYPLTDRDRRQLVRSRKVRALHRAVEVEVPDYGDDEATLDTQTSEANPNLDGRESIRYQAKVAQSGAEMGFLIWVPRNDKVRVLENIPLTLQSKFLDILPLNYDDATLKPHWCRGGT